MKGFSLGLKWTDSGLEDVLLQRIQSSVALATVQAEPFAAAMSTVHFGVREGARPATEGPSTKINRSDAKQRIESKVAGRKWSGFIADRLLGTESDRTGFLRFGKRF
jgi:hypothetical protein